jgi:hypothetical protein
LSHCVTCLTGEELNNRVVEYVARAMKDGGKQKGGAAGRSAEEESERKGKAEDEEDGRGTYCTVPCCTVNSVYLAMRCVVSSALVKPIRTAGCRECLKLQVRPVQYKGRIA